MTGEKNANNLKNKLAYYVKKGNILRLRKGIFAKDKDYDPKELAAKIYTPAYVSFETILVQEGVIFQYYETIFMASYLSREIATKKDKITYRKLKNDILVNQQGVTNQGAYFQASKERAFLDTLYVFGDYYFDNLRGINWKTCLEMVPIYKMKNFEKKVKDYQQKYANQ